MLVQLCIIIMSFFSLFSIILGNSFTLYSESINISNSQIVNGSTTTFSIPDISYSLNISGLTIGLTFLTVVIIGIAVGIGIRVIGSGLSDTAGRAILIISAYASLWGILSLLTFNLIITIEIYGALIYAFLTIMYIVGVIQKLSEGGG